MQMVGHVLGLGDRHINNILIDNTSGEVVHIDLGVAFEQGRILPTPEKIPFRLTRDIVDGFGPAGVEGVFRACCEQSITVLRQNSQAVLTVLEVMNGNFNIARPEAGKVVLSVRSECS